MSASVFASVLLVLGMLAAGLATVSLLIPDPHAPDGDPEAEGLETLLAACIWALGVIPLVTFWVAMLLRLYETPSLLALATTLNLVCAVVAFRVLRRPVHTIAHAIFTTVRRPAVVASSAVAVVYLCLYDSRQPLDVSCIYHAALIAVGRTGEAMNLLESNPDDARLGNAALLAAALTLFGPLGLRLVHAACGFLIALGGYAIGNRAAGRAGAWFGLLFLPLNPYVLTIALPDENLLALAVGSALIPILLRPYPPVRTWLLAGVFFGLLFTIRHVMVLALAAPLLVVWRTNDRLRASLAFLAGLVVTTFPEHLHHALALGSVFRFESNPQYPPQSYEFLGLPFSWQGLVNWPIHDHVVRTPFNPFPTFVLWPLALARHLGWGLFAMLHLGFVRNWVRDPRSAAFWTAWAVPVAAALAEQEAWDQANKMGVILIISQAGLAWVLEGARWLRAHPIRAGLAVTTFALAAAIGTWALADWRAPADERYDCLTGAGIERSDLLAEATRDALQIAPWPRPLWPRQASPSFLAGNLRSFWTLLRDPDSGWTPHPLGFFAQEVPAPGPAVTLRLDLSRNPFEEPFVFLGDGPADITLMDPDAVSVFAIPAMDWSSRPLQVVVRRGPLATAILVDYPLPDRPHCPRWSSGPEVTDEFVRENWCEVSGWLAGTDTERCPFAEAPVVEFRNTALRLKIPAGAVSVAIVVNWRGENYRLHHGLVSPRGIEWRARNRPFWHN